MAYDERNLCETAKGRPARERPLSDRMKAVLLLLYRAGDQPKYVIGPGHDFQTCVSLRNRGELTGGIFGEAPRQSIRVELTASGRAKAQRLAQQEQTVRLEAEAPKAWWPFQTSSRGWHMQTR